MHDGHHENMDLDMCRFHNPDDGSVSNNQQIMDANGLTMFDQEKMNTLSTHPDKRHISSLEGDDNNSTKLTHPELQDHVISRD